MQLLVCLLKIVFFILKNDRQYYNIMLMLLKNKLVSYEQFYKRYFIT